MTRPAPPLASPTGAPLSRVGAMAAAALSAACWGGATVLSKGVLVHLPPLTLVAVQLSASVAALWLAVFLTRARVRLDRQTRAASLSGLLEPGLAYLFGVAGLALTTASHAAVIGAVEPILILALAWATLGERVGARVFALAVVATAGILLVMAPDAGDAPQRGSLLGDALVLVGVFFAAFYVISTRRLLRTVDPLPLAALQQSAGLILAAVALAVAAGLGVVTLGLEDASAGVLAAAALSGVVQYALAFWFYMLALRRLSATVAGLFLTLIPVFGVSAAVLFLGEAMAPAQWVGALCVIVAVGAISRADGRSDPSA